MNKERELLERALSMIESAYESKKALILCDDIKELLAQSEQKLMTNRAIIQACPEYYGDMEKAAFRVGIKWYEKYIARIGVYSNE